MTRRNRTWLVVIVALVLVVCCGGATLFGLLALRSATTRAAGPGGMGRTVAVIPVHGVITSGRGGGFAADTIAYADRVVADIEAAEADPRIRAIVLEVNSPGGSVAASAQIYRALREVTKPTVTSMGEVAASGGYYIACAADRIYANPGSITGSIGVIAEWYNYGDLLRWAKMQDVVIKSGEFKDAGSPTRPLTEAERAYFQALIDTMYGQFVSAVASGRGMKEEVVRNLADGRVYTGEQAKKDGLVDELGGLEDAIAAAAEMGGVTGKPGIVEPAKKSFSILELLLGDSSSALSLNRDRSGSHIRFEYLWR